MFKVTVVMRMKTRGYTYFSKLSAFRDINRASLPVTTFQYRKIIKSLVNC